MKVLVTGATGFVGSHLVEKLISVGAEIYSLERISSKPNLLGCLAYSPQIHRIYHDFRSPLPDRVLEELQDVSYVVHAGAEVHGLRSLENPELFVQSNVIGTFHLLEAARKLNLAKFVYVSSAEVIGSAPAPLFWDEDRALCPSNPYAAAKAAGEMLCRTYFASYKVPTMVVRSMNVFGERQDTSKFIPATIKKILAGEPVTVHVDGNGKSGSRQWLHVKQFVDALCFMTGGGSPGETYHVVGPEKTNQEIVSHLAWALKTPLRQHTAIPGKSHDMRYAIKDTKIPEGVYKADVGNLGIDLANTALFYKENREWLES